MIELVVIICAMTEGGHRCTQAVFEAPPHMSDCNQFDEAKAARAVGLLLIGKGIKFERVGVRCQEGA